MRRETFILVAMPVLFALGFFLGKQSDTTSTGINPGVPDADNPQIGVESKLSKTSPHRSNSTTQYIYRNVPAGSEYAQGDLRKALKSTLAETNPMKRLSGLANVLAELDEDNLADVLEAFDNFPLSFETSQEYRLLMYAWGQFDAPSAIEYMREKAGGGRSGGRAIWFGGFAAMSGWAANDPQAAIAWVQEQDDPRMRGGFNMGIVSSWVTKDAKSAADYVATLDRNHETGRMLGMVSTELLKQGRQVATSWAEGIADERLKEDAFRNLTRLLARDDVDGATDWLEKHVNQKYSDESFDTLAEEWSRMDPEASLKFFMSLPEGSSQREGVIESVQTWTRKDAEAAGDWINENLQESTSAKDLAKYSYAREIVRDSPEDAVEWAGSIGDAELKQKSLVEVGQRWFRQDAEAAQAWLPDSGLPEEAVNKVQNPPQHDFRGWHGRSPSGGQGGSPRGGSGGGR